MIDEIKKDPEMAVTIIGVAAALLMLFVAPRLSLLIVIAVSLYLFGTLRKAKEEFAREFEGMSEEEFKDELAKICHHSDSQIHELGRIIDEEA